jgi:RNA polymerase sigma-70 factor (ECF subfamily)
LSGSSDRALVTAIAVRRADALAEAYRRHGDAVLALATRLVNDRVLAQDVVQDVFVRLWDQPDRFSAGRGSLRTFLMVGTRGRAIDVLRSELDRRRRETRHGRQGVDLGGAFESSAASRCDAAPVQAALALLPRAERQAIELAYFVGHTYREVAQLLQISEGTAKGRIRAGLGRLRVDDSMLEAAAGA